MFRDFRDFSGSYFSRLRGLRLRVSVPCRSRQRRQSYRQSSRQSGVSHLFRKYYPHYPRFAILRRLPEVAMKCEICHQAEAVTVIHETVDGEVCERFVCEACARREDDDSPDVSDASSMMVEILLDAALALADDPDRVSRIAGEKPCPACGMTRQEYRKRSRLGCAGCYDHFERELQPVLRDMHCGERHAGKVPERARHATMRQRLEAALAEAVGQQQFEQAARLRDQLNELGPVPEKPVDAVRGGDA